MTNNNKKKNVMLASGSKVAGDAAWCDKCKAYTVYGNACAICTVPSQEDKLRYSGNLSYLKSMYSGL